MRSAQRAGGHQAHVGVGQHRQSLHCPGGNTRTSARIASRSYRRPAGAAPAHEPSSRCPAHGLTGPVLPHPGGVTSRSITYVRRPGRGIGDVDLQQEAVLKTDVRAGVGYVPFMLDRVLRRQEMERGGERRIDNTIANRLLCIA